MKNMLLSSLLVGFCLSLLAQPISKQEIVLSYERPPLKDLSDQVKSVFMDVKIRGGAHYSHGTKEIYIAEPVFSKSFPNGSREFDLVDKKEDYMKAFLQPDGVRKVEVASEADMTIQLTFGLIKVHEYKSPQVARHYYRFSLPVKVEASNSSGEILLSEDVYTEEKEFRKTVSTSKTSIPKAGSDVATVLLCQDIVKGAFAQAGNLVKKHFFHSMVQRSFPLLGVNKSLVLFGKKKYQAVFDAETYMLRAIEAQYAGESFHKDLEKAQHLWKKMLEEGGSTKKSMVTPKLREALIYNLSLSHGVAGQAQKGLGLLSEDLITGKFSSEVAMLKAFLEEAVASGQDTE